MAELPPEFNNGTDSHTGDTFHFSSTEGFNPIAEYEPAEQVLKIPIPIPCDHQWEKSNWNLVDSSTKTYHNEIGYRSGVFHETETIPGHIGNLEVCGKCGLLRINPKDLKK